MNLGKLDPRCHICGAGHKPDEPHIILKSIEESRRELKENRKRFALSLPLQNEKFLKLIGEVLNVIKY